MPLKKSKTEKPLLALTDAKPSMNIRKTLFKKDSEALLRQLIKSTTIPKQEKEKVLLALTNTSHSSNNTLNTIENHLGHKVSDIVPFLSQPASSSLFHPSTWNYSLVNAHRAGTIGAPTTT